MVGVGTLKPDTLSLEAASPAASIVLASRCTSYCRLASMEDTKIVYLRMESHISDRRLQHKEERCKWKEYVRDEQGWRHRTLQCMTCGEQLRQWSA